MSQTKAKRTPGRKWFIAGTIKWGCYTIYTPVKTGGEDIAAYLELSRGLRSHADLLAAAEAALSLLTGSGQDGTLGYHSDNPVPAALRAAIAKVKGGAA